MLAHCILRGNALFCNSLHFQFPNERVDGLVQDCGNSSALAMELLQSCTKLSMYCYRKHVLALLPMIMYANDRGQFMQAYIKKYVAWLHVLITLYTSQASHVHTLFLRWYALVVFQTEWKNNCDHSHFSQFQIAASTVLMQQVPFSFSKYRSLAYILMSRYLLFKFALPFSLARSYKLLVQPYRGFPRLFRYFETFLRTFSTPVHTQPLPRSRDAA